uniref:Morphogenetic protein n=1 Tax=viral metagenome TaxID=1070528 RepID=A0A6M3IM23_9ZZZZ
MNKEKPIIFSGPMVRAVLEGRKTQTRRIIKPQPDLCGDGSIYYPDRSASRWKHYVSEGHFIRGVAVDFSPYGQPGTKLWVRETWQLFFDDEISPDRFRGPRGTMGIPAQPERLSFAFYRADGDLINPEFGKAHWMSPLYMPRKYSRITLEITNVRVERVQDISEEDARSEGAQKTKNGWSMEHPRPKDECLSTARTAFANYFCKLHGGKKWNLKPTNLWDVNPWVWVIEFKRLTP